MTTIKIDIPRDDREIFDLCIDIDGERENIRGQKLNHAVGYARQIGHTLREGDELIVSDPDGRIHYKETSGSVYFRK